MSVLGTLGAIGSIGGAAIGAVGASKAAGSQAAAAEQAAQLQHEDAQAALNFQIQQWMQNQRNIAPWLQTGANAATTLGRLMGLPSTNINTSTLGVPEGGVGTTNPWTTPEAQLSVPLNATGTTSLQSMMTPVRDINGNIVNMPQGTPQGFDPSMFNRLRPTTVGADGGSGFDPNGPNFDLGGGGTPSSSPLFAPSAQGPFVGDTGGVENILSPGETSGQLQPFTNWSEKFQAPTDVTEQNDPGFQFRLKQGQDALERSAAARGNLLTGGTAKAIDQYSQDYASNEYSNVYNRALTEFQQRYNIFNQNQATQFNRLAALSGYGQTAAGQLSSAGGTAAGQVGNILLGSGAQIGQDIQNIGAARGSGYAGVSNAISGGLGGLTGLASLYALMKNQNPFAGASASAFGG